MSNKPKLVLVEWLDATSETTPWPDKAKVEGLAAARVHTVGWLVRQNDDEIVLAADYQQDVDAEEDTPFGGVQLIPRGMVKKIVHLRRPGVR